MSSNLMLHVMELFCQNISVHRGTTSNMWAEKQYNELEQIMLRLKSQPEHGPINMAWMLVNFSGPNGEESFDSYRHFGELALKAGCFVYLEQFLRHKMFKVSFFIS
jgi:hypothetical protein